MRVRTLAVLLGLWLVAAPAAAQEQRASIEGTVKDNTGAVLPGVTVDAKNLSQGGVASAVSDAGGFFRFPSLAPGAYEVTAKLSGFTPKTFSRVELTLGQTKALDVALGVSGLSETVQVTSEQPLIDVKSSQRAYSITADQFVKLPKGRDFSSVVTQAPGANFEAKSAGITIDGATAGENRFIVDGVETTNPQSGMQGKRMSLDFVQEVQVKSSGYAAEFGGSTGGVINVITRSGSNDFHGDGLLYFNNDGMNGAERETLRLVPTNSRAAEYVTLPKDGSQRLEPGIGVGGPVMKDKLWFFASYLPSLEKFERSTQFSNGTPVDARADRQHPLLLGQRHVAADQQPRAARSPTTRPSATSSASCRAARCRARTARRRRRRCSTPTTSGRTGRCRATTTTSSTTSSSSAPRAATTSRTSTTRASPRRRGSSSTARPTSACAGVPAQFQQPQRLREHPDQPQRHAQRLRPRQLPGRRHLLRQLRRLAHAQGRRAVRPHRQRRARFRAEQPDSHHLESAATPVTRNPRRFGHYQVRSNGVNPDQGFSVEGDIANTNVGLFIQDSWAVNDRLTLNLGLRTENESVPSYTTSDGIAPVAIEWGFGEKLAPRLGFAYDIAGDGKTKLYGNWGIYYDIFKLELPQGSFGGQKWLEYCYTLDTPNFDVARSRRLPAGVPGPAARWSDRLPSPVERDRRRDGRPGHQADEAPGIHDGLRA